MRSAQQNPPKDCPRDQPGDNSALHSKTSSCKNPLGSLRVKGNLLGVRLSATQARSDPKEPKKLVLFFFFFFILPFPSPSCLFTEAPLVSQRPSTPVLILGPHLRSRYAPSKDLKGTAVTEV